MRCLIAALLLSTCALAQNVTELSVAFVAKPGQYRTDLVKEDVRVTENGAPQRVLSLEPAASQPRCVALLVDNSASISGNPPSHDRTRLIEPINAALAWLRQTVPANGNRAMVVNFNDNYHLDQRLTDSIPSLTGAIQKADVRGATALYSALIAASADLAKDAPPDCRKVIVALTDAVDNASRQAQGEAVGAVRRAGATLYIVGLRDRHPLDITRNLAESTGGEYFSGANRGDLQKAFLALEQDLNARYRLAYASMSPRNVRVPVSVSLWDSSRKKLGKLHAFAPQFREVPSIPQ